MNNSSSIEEDIQFPLMDNNKRFGMRDDAERPSPEFHVQRHALTIEERHHKFAFSPQPKYTIAESCRSKLANSLKCSKSVFLKWLFLRLPILQWGTEYRVKQWLMGDVIAGLTVAIMHIPQGMAFAMLAHIPAIAGIYMAFFPVLVYAIFGTSRHSSMGTFAVITLMTGKVVKDLATFPSALESSMDFNVTSDVAIDDVATQIEPTFTPLQVATIVCFMVGTWQIIMGLLQFGSLSVFLSDNLVSGFTTAAAFHVLTSQLKDMLGISIAGYSGPFKIIRVRKQPHLRPNLITN